MAVSHVSPIIRASGWNGERLSQSPTDVIFVALGALDFGIYEDDLIVGRDVAVVSLRVRSELSQSADSQSERSRASFGQHSSQAEEEDEIVQVVDDCFHLAESHS